jgi:hypothetical protein
MLVLPKMVAQVSRLSIPFSPCFSCVRTDRHTGAHIITRGAVIVYVGVPYNVWQDAAVSAELLVFAAKHKLPNLTEICRTAVAADFMRSGGAGGGSDAGGNCVFADPVTGLALDARLSLPPDELRRLLMDVIRRARDALWHNAPRQGWLAH